MYLENIKKENKNTSLGNLLYDLESSYYMIPQGYKIKIYGKKKIEELVNNITNNIIDLRFVVYYYLGQRYLIGNVDDIFNLYCYNNKIRISGRKIIWSGLEYSDFKMDIKRNYQIKNYKYQDYNSLKIERKVFDFMVEVISYHSLSEEEWLNFYEKLNYEFDKKINSMEKWLFPKEYSNIRYLYKYIPGNYRNKYSLLKTLAAYYDLDKNKSLITQFKYLLPSLKEDLLDFYRLNEKELKRVDFIKEFKKFKRRNK